MNDASARVDAITKGRRKQEVENEEEKLTKT